MSRTNTKSSSMVRDIKTKKIGSIIFNESINQSNNENPSMNLQYNPKSKPASSKSHIENKTKEQEIDAMIKYPFIHFYDYFCLMIHSATHQPKSRNRLRRCVELVSWLCSSWSSWLWWFRLGCQYWSQATKTRVRRRVSWFDE